MTQGNSKSNLHRGTQYRSKIRHATVTGVTCDTTCPAGTVPPPLGQALGGHEKTEHVYTCKKMKPDKVFRKSLEKLEKDGKSQKIIHKKKVTICPSIEENKNV